MLFSYNLFTTTVRYFISTSTNNAVSSNLCSNKQVLISFKIFVLILNSFLSKNNSNKILCLSFLSVVQTTKILLVLQFGFFKKKTQTQSIKYLSYEVI